MSDITRLREFVQLFTQLIDLSTDDEERILKHGKVLLSELIEHDDWLPEQFAIPGAEHYQQYLLYCDPLERFSVVSFVWGPGQTTPVHDHTVWGMVGVMRGSELCEEFNFTPDEDGLIVAGSHQIAPGGIDLVSPRIGDIHRVSNALADKASVSIHVYGANIGAVSRHVYDLPGGNKRTFISGYSSTVVPNLWDRSLQTTAG